MEIVIAVAIFPCVIDEGHTQVNESAKVSGSVLVR